jgi:predicted alpha/beta-hydrolase family hydrolase
MPVAFRVPGDDDTTYAATLYAADVAARMNAVFVFAHGAGAGQAHPFMVRYARGLADRGLDVVTFNFPYMERGKSAPDRAPVLEATFRRVVSAAASHRHVRADRVFIGGKSMGGRMATHVAAAPATWPADAPPLAGVVVFGYPLNPPGGSRRSADRVSHLFALAAPALIVQGTRDNFGGPDDLRRALAATPLASPITIHDVPTGDHSLAVLKSAGPQDDVDRSIWDHVGRWTADPRSTS